MTRTVLILAAAGLLVPAASALANDAENRLTNPSFEDADPNLPFLPDGWGDVPQDVPFWTDAFARTGSMSIEIPAPSFTAFVGWTTNIFDGNGDLFDPQYDYGGGDYKVSGYYMIPENDPLAPEGETAPYDIVGLKVELRRVPPNFSIYQAFEYTLGEVVTTNGEWVYFEALLTPEEVSPDFPPFPGSATIVPFRFRVGGTPTPQGTIYWDDLCVVQMSAGPVCVGDVNTTNTNPGDPGYGEPDGAVDGADLSFYVENWLGQNAAVADVNTTNTNPGDAAYGQPDGTVDGADLSFFVENWLAGCP